MTRNVSQGHIKVSYSKVKKNLFNGQEYLAFSIEVLRNTVCFVLIIFNFPGFNEHKLEKLGQNFAFERGNVT